MTNSFLVAIVVNVRLSTEKIGENMEMRYGYSKITGTLSAQCEECDFISVYWECEEDLAHECCEDNEEN